MVFEAKARSDSGGLDTRESAIGRTEIILIERIRKGEKELFADLIQPYERQVYITALAILQNEADAQDVAQEAILKAFTHLWQFRGDSRFSTWLTRVTINEARRGGEKSIATSSNIFTISRRKIRKAIIYRRILRIGRKFRRRRWNARKFANYW